MAHKTLLYDLSFLGDGRVSGVERFSIEIYKELINTENRKVLAVLPKGYDKNKINPAIDNFFMPFNNKMLNHIFMFYILLLKKVDSAFFAAFPPFPVFYILSKFKGVSLIRVIHDVVYWQEKAELSLKSKIYLKPLESWMLRRYKKIVTVSKYSAKKINEVLGINNVSVCPNGVASVFKPLKSEKDKKVIKLVSVGTIEPRKNYPFLVDVLEALVGLGVDVELSILGRAGWGYEELVSKIDSSPCSDKIRLECDLTDEQLNIEYSKASLFLFPSFEEGFGIPIIEAMRNGLPVIAADNSAITEVVDQYGVLIDDYEASDWANEIIKLMNSEREYSKMVELSYARSSCYSWANSADTLMRLVDEI